MPAARIAIALDRALLRAVDSHVRKGLFCSRSQAIETAVREKLGRRRKSRLAAEARKLDPKEERAWAELI